jgi:hypothetical protein
MDVQLVDPRDTTWESDEPAYRVYFWRRSSDRPMAGWASEEWRLSGTDAPEVLMWAQEQAKGRLVTVWVEHVDRDLGLGMIRLQGWEPTRNDESPPWVG